MAYVITEKCLGERYGTCVSVCPVECIYPGEHQGREFMVIDPEVCISCGLCLPECPINAIVDSEDQDPEWAKINAQLSPEYKNNAPVPERPRDDPPRRPDNQLVQ